jgi:hypothetical protein
MGKFKSKLMEREDEFWSIAQDNIGDCDSVEEFVDLMKEHYDLHSKTDKKVITEELQDMWFDTYNHIYMQQSYGS